MNNENTHKLRAVFLAAMMFLWLFAGTVALAGSATAQFNAEDPTHGDAPWASGQSAWQGQQLYFQADGTADDTNYQLREIDVTAADPVAGSIEKEFVLSADEFRVIDTSNLEGDYVITRDGRNNVVETDETGVEIDDGDADDAADFAVEISVQRLDVEFDDDELRLGQATTVEIDSNRGTFTLNVSETDEQLTASEIAELFDAEDPQQLDDDVVAIATSSGAELEFNTSDLSFDLDEGETYEFRFDVQDTTAEDTANVTIGDEIEGQIDFTDAVFVQNRGDIVNVTFETQELDNVTLDIGGQEAGYNASLVIEPEDDFVAVEINTFMVGDNPADIEGDFDISDAFDVTVGSLDVDRSSEDALSRVMEVGLYDLSASNEDGDELDVAVLQIEERSTDSLTVHTAPSREFTRLNNLERILERADNGWVTESDEIAIAPSDRADGRQGDAIVHELSASGLEGYLAATGTTSVGEFATSDEFTLSMWQLNPSQNRLPKTLSEETGADAFHLVADPANNTYYIVAKSDRLAFDRTVESPGSATGLTEGDGDFELRRGDEFNVSVTTTSTFENYFIRGGEAGNQTVSDEFDVVDRTLSFDTIGGNVTVDAVENAEITGVTSVAPGTELNVRARATGESPFLMTNRTRIDADGEFAAIFDFSDVEEGQEFTASVSGQSFDDLARTPGIVGEPVGSVFEVSDLDPTDVTVEQGDVIEVSATITNTGDQDDTQTVEFRVDGDALASEEVSLSPDENTTVVFSDIDTAGLEPGNYEHGVFTLDDSQTATLTVEGEETPTPTETPTPDADDDDEPPADDDDQAGFGAVVALIALLAAALIAARRHSFDN